MTSSATGVISGRLFLGTANLPFNGVLDTFLGGGQPQATIIVRRTAPLTSMLLTFTMDPDNDLVSPALLEDGIESLEFSAVRRIFSSTVPATDYEGYHTLLLGITPEHAGEAGIPQGVGYTSLTITRDGTGTLAGKLSDNTTITGTTYVRADGSVVVFQLLYTTLQKGSLVGVMQMSPGAFPGQRDVSGDLTWTRPPDTASSARTYRLGFGPVNLLVSGSSYIPPVAPAIVMDLTPGLGNAMLSFIEGGIGDTVVSPDSLLNVTTGSKVTLPAPNPLKITLTFTAAKGNFTGNVTLVDTNPVNPALRVTRTFTFQGMLVNVFGAWRGAGYFLLPQLPSVSPPTTSTNSPILSGNVEVFPAP